jgi:SAM-dependent methyltransferase
MCGQSPDIRFPTSDFPHLPFSPLQVNTTHIFNLRSDTSSKENMPEVTTEANGPLNLLRPFLLLFYSAYYIVPTMFSLITSLNFKPFFSFSDFKDEWFARFWVFFGPRSREVVAPAVMPLLQHNARGVCLDIGPGTGQWLTLYSRANNKDITKIYGVEPNIGMHKDLRANAVKAGLADVYEIIGCGAEELGTKGGIKPNSIDTIITVQCLCSIPTPEKIIKELYPLLKPGGQWLVFEHVRTKYQGDFVAHWQRRSQ